MRVVKKSATAVLLLFALLSQTLLGSQSPSIYTDPGGDPSALSGKSILFFGDSLTNGHGLSSFDLSWCGMLAAEYGMEVETASIGGSTLGAADITTRTPGGCFSPVCRREFPDGDFDIIFIEGGGNDWYCEIPPGDDPESRNSYTVMGALNVILDRAQTVYPDALIVCSTSWNSTGEENGLGLTTEDYNQALITVCNLRGIPIFHANDPSVSGIDTSTANTRGDTFLRSTDFWHLSEQGHRQYLPVIATWLQAIVAADYAVCGFYDVIPADSYADDITFVYNHGILSGTSAHSFELSLALTRGMAITGLYRICGSPEVSSGSSFTDVASGSWYQRPVCWAVSAGIASGTSDNTFSPEQAISRQQFAVMLYRCALALDCDIIEKADLSAFTDGDEVADYATEAVAWANAAGILRGTGPDTLNPRGTVTRGQAAILFRRFCDFCSIYE